MVDTKEETYENKTTTEIENNITEFMINVDENKIVLDYDITEGVDILDISSDIETNSLIIKLNATEKGLLQLHYHAM